MLSVKREDLKKQEETLTEQIIDWLIFKSIFTMDTFLKYSLTNGIMAVCDCCLYKTG